MNDMEASTWRMRAIQFAAAIVDLMDGMKDHDIGEHTGLQKDDCERIAQARKDALVIWKHGELTAPAAHPSLLKMGRLIIDVRTAVWDPKADITPLELAVCAPMLPLIGRPSQRARLLREYEVLPENAQRHWHLAAVEG